MIPLRLLLILPLILSTTQTSIHWKAQVVDLLKQLVNILPIPYSSKINLYCGGKGAELWFRAAATIDKDKNLVTGVDPRIDDVNVHVNLSNFKIPSIGKYTCKVSLETFTFNDLLLLNLTGNNFDVTKLINNDVIHSIYSSLFEDSGIHFNVDWSLRPSTGTSSGTTHDSTDQGSRNYQISALYPIFSKFMQYIFHLPKTIMAKLVKLGSNTKSKLETTAPVKSKNMKTTTDTDNVGLNFKELGQLFNGKKMSTSNTRAVKDSSRHSQDYKTGKLHVSDAALLLENKEKYSSKKTRSGQWELKAAVVASCLFSFGVITLTVSIIFAFVFYRKYIRGRRNNGNIEAGISNRPTLNRAPIKARKGPCGMRVKTARIQQTRSAPVSTNEPFTNNHSPIFASLQEENNNRSLPQCINRQLSEPNVASSQNSDLRIQLTISDSCPALLSSHTIGKSDSLKAVTAQAAGSAHGALTLSDATTNYSHMFKGCHLNTMRKVTTMEELPQERPENDSMKTTVIFVKPYEN